MKKILQTCMFILVLGVALFTAGCPVTLCSDPTGGCVPPPCDPVISICSEDP